MSECVVRMDFPDDNCPIGYSFMNIGYCPVEGHRRCDFFDTKERPSWCPIICSLPEGHGRLVDAEILKAKLIEHIAETNCFYHAFKETPTIVLAERSATCLD